MAESIAGTATSCRVRVEQGWLQGEHSANNGLCVFRGIPYAAPPIGPRRFRPAEAAAPWSGVRDARAFGPASAQVFDPHEGLLEEFLDQPHTDGAAPSWVGSEDSLTLNVWTPGCDAQARPVIIYIHGGANWLEASRLGVYDGHHLAAEGDVVVVTLNYRLGIFGFLDLSCLGDDAPRGCSRLGLSDQLLALTWVRDNIRHFGGDLNNMTLVGESAGSMDISWHIALGNLRGLVRRVVMMSGVASLSGFGRDGECSVHSLEYGKDQASKFLHALGVDSYDELRGLSTDTLLDRQARLIGEWNVLFDLDTLFYPRKEHADDLDPFEAALAGRSGELDIMIGYTAYEMGLWLLWDDQLDQRSTQWAAAMLRGFPNEKRHALASLYDHAMAQLPAGIRAMHLLGDAMFVMPSLAFADMHARSGGRLWMYEFDFVPSDPRRGALHAADQVFFFGTYSTAGAQALLGSPATAADAQRWHALSENMMRRLINFARDGYPETVGAMQWPQYTIEHPSLLSFSADPRIVRHPHRERMSWWQNEIITPGMEPGTRGEHCA